MHIVKEPQKIWQLIQGPVSFRNFISAQTRKRCKFFVVYRDIQPSTLPTVYYY